MRVLNDLFENWYPHRRVDWYSLLLLLLQNPLLVLVLFLLRLELARRTENGVAIVEQE